MQEMLALFQKNISLFSFEQFKGLLPGLRLFLTTESPLKITKNSLSNVCLVTICCPFCDVINFEISLVYLV